MIQNKVVLVPFPFDDFSASEVKVWSTRRREVRYRSFTTLLNFMP